ncbi:hypothetical protein, partial [Nocardia vaccinii]|uniref:hypothetical protein n=1 Tax=Nocardia vaccinii TaxID=1822 RepID=UPI001C3F7EB1
INRSHPPGWALPSDEQSRCGRSQIPLASTTQVPSRTSVGVVGLGKSVAFSPLIKLTFSEVEPRRTEKVSP